MILISLRGKYYDREMVIKFLENKKAKHIPHYQNEKELNDVLLKISKYPPLVFAGEARMLENKLAEVSNGKAFYCRVVIVQKVFLIFILTT